MLVIGNGPRLIGLGLMLLASSAWSMPNIRIQVNNENLQSPPYLLEAIKHAEESERAAAAAAAANSSVQAAPSPNETANETDVSTPKSFNVVKEETIEEIFDLDHDVMKSSPEFIASSVPSQDYAKIYQLLSGASAAPLAQPSEPSQTSSSQLVDSKRRPEARQTPQLPVTSSHLKRPAGSGGIMEDQEAAASSVASETRAQMDDEDALMATSDASSPIAASRLGPSVAADEGAPTVNLDKKPGQEPPDTLEPSQVMQGVSNASLVPATVTRQYGTNSRTRVTLGGGYVRNKQPPLVNPASSEYVDDKPEKPVVPLERPEKSHDNSRLIEVPERIVLPASVFNQDQKQAQNHKIVRDNILLLNVTTTVDKPAPLGKPDSRCPSTGTTTLEHPTACDKYFFCEDGHISEHICPNGLMYGSRNHVKDYCVHRWEAVCGDKSVPNPISSPGCRWQWGIFNVQGSPRCTPDFYECQDGEFQVRKCPTIGQVYDDRTKSCRFAEQVGCAEEALADFRCPPDDQGNTYWPFPRYFLNERSLIHCINDKPAIIRCRDNERVDPEHLHCVLDKRSPSSSHEVGDSLASRSLRERSKKNNQTQAQ